MSTLPSESERAAAAALSAAGFATVRFVPPSTAARSADLVAERFGERWAVEVREATRPLREDGSFEPIEPGEKLPYPTLQEYFDLMWSEKWSQLAATMSVERCGKGLLVAVVEGKRGGAWEKALESAWHRAGRPQGMRFALVHGGTLIGPLG